MGTIGNLAAVQAATSTSGGTSGLLILALPLLLLAWMFWSSTRRQKGMRAFNSSLDVGDKVITSSGIYGTIKHLDDASAYLDIADGMVIRFDRRAVAMKQTEAQASTTSDAPRAPGADGEQ